MRSVIIKKLKNESFGRYGNFASLIQPEGDKIGIKPVEFFRDIIQQSLGSISNVSYSSCVVGKRPLVVDCTEVHDNCHETFICLDGDCLVHVAPACPKGDAPYDDIEVFFVPQGTLVNIKAGVWHHAPFAYNCNVAHVLCALPERTYATDTTLLEIPKDHQIAIEDVIEN